MEKGVIFGEYSQTREIKQNTTSCGVVLLVAAVLLLYTNTLLGISFMEKVGLLANTSIPKKCLQLHKL